MSLLKPIRDSNQPPYDGACHQVDLCVAQLAVAGCVRIEAPAKGFRVDGLRDVCSYRPYRDTRRRYTGRPASRPSSGSHRERPNTPPKKLHSEVIAAYEEGASTRQLAKVYKNGIKALKAIDNEAYTDGFKRLANKKWLALRNEKDKFGNWPRPPSA